MQQSQVKKKWKIKNKKKQSQVSFFQVIYPKENTTLASRTQTPALAPLPASKKIKWNIIGKSVTLEPSQSYKEARKSRRNFSPIKLWSRPSTRLHWSQSQWDLKPTSRRKRYSTRSLPSSWATTTRRNSSCRDTQDLSRGLGVKWAWDTHC